MVVVMEATMMVMMMIILMTSMMVMRVMKVVCLEDGCFLKRLGIYAHKQYFLFVEFFLSFSLLMLICNV